MNTIKKQGNFAENITFVQNARKNMFKELTKSALSAEQREINTEKI